MKGVPCVHMVVALKSGSIIGLNENNFMPSWWMISQMHLQYPVDMEIKVEIIALLMSDGVGWAGTQEIWQAQGRRKDQMCP